tara:strand:+ start:922 stop:1071 length:150 start_codon:yes stop_codon:yes gene_type:complete
MLINKETYENFKLALEMHYKTPFLGEDGLRFMENMVARYEWYLALEFHP